MIRKGCTAEMQRAQKKAKCPFTVCIFSIFLFCVFSLLTFGNVIYLEKNIRRGISQGFMPIRTLTIEGTNYVFIICEGSSNVLVYDKYSQTFVKSIKVGRYPQDGILFKNLLFVNDNLGKGVSVIETKTFRMIKQFEGRFNGFYLSSDGKDLYFDEKGMKRIFDLQNLELQIPSALPPLRSSKDYVSPSRVRYKIDANLMQIEIKRILSNNEIVKLRYYGIPVALFVYNEKLYILDKATSTLNECEVIGKSISVKRICKLRGTPADITFDSLRKEIYVVDSELNLFIVLDLNTLSVKRKFTLGVYPRDMAIYDTHLLVVGMMSNVLYDIEDGKITYKIPLLSFLPQHIVVNNRGETAYISEFGNSVNIINLSTMSTIKHIKLDMSSRQLAYNPSRDVLYILIGNSEVGVFNIQKGFIASKHLKISPGKIVTDGKSVYVIGNTSIEKYDWRMDTLSLEKQLNFTPTEMIVCSSKIYIAGNGILNIYDVDTFGRVLNRTISIKGKVNTLYYYKGRLYIGEGSLRRVIVLDTSIDRIVDLIPTEKEFDKIIVKDGFLYTLSTSGGYIECDRL